MKKFYALAALIFFLAGCDTFGAAPQPFPVWTALPTITPSIITATPLVIPPPVFENSPTVVVVSPVTPTNTEIPSPTLTFSAMPPTVALTPTPFQAVDMVILGCNTSIDIRNGMGEVTNAYVTIKNTGTLDLPNTCGLLRAIDEGREHPDKKVCTPNLPAQNQVTVKLTVDSTYRQDTIIQVDVTSNENILLRVDRHSCRDIGLFGGAPSDVGVIKPLTP
jgi:hypothetical protein